MTASDFTLQRLADRDAGRDRDMIASRLERFRQRQPAESAPLLVDPAAEVAGQGAGCVPELEAAQFDCDSLRSAIDRHGAVIVRGLFSRAETEALIAATDRVINACAGDADNGAADANTFFNPPGNLASLMPNGARELGNTRNFHRDSGSAMCVEAPSVAEALLQMYENRGLKALVTRYLGEPPCLSAKKWVLRRSKLPVAEAGWHQDGAFMGTAINSINLWLPLNECGGDTGAPGMDVVPLRLNRIASADGAQFDWSVSHDHVHSRFTDSQPQTPVFNAGDGFFFDHFYLHRTQFRTDFTRIRYAIETWFFGESRFPKNQIPLAW